MSGNQKPGMIRTYPEDAIQSTIVPPGEWWVEDPSGTYECGRLIKAFIPHTEQQPLVIMEAARTNGTENKSFLCRIEPLDLKKPQKRSNLPVPGLPVYQGEVRSVYRAKKRPALIIARQGKDVPGKLTRDKPKSQYAPTLLVVPVYGADESGTRAGFSEAFLERVRKCEYSQFMLDWLPLPGSPAGSIMRIDHIQPVGFHYHCLESTEWKLSADALDILYEWIEWHFSGAPPEGGSLEYQIQINLGMA